MYLRSLCLADRCDIAPALVSLALFSLLAINARTVVSQELAKSNGWICDFDEAIAQAKQSGQDLFIDFAGDDSSIPSRRFLEQVLVKPDFQSEARKDFILTLITVDKALSAADTSLTRSKTAALHESYQVRGFPTVILADRSGRPYAKFVGFHGESVDEMMNKLDGAIETRLVRDQRFSRAESLSGIERARLLHKAIDPIQDSWKVRHYRSEIEDIIANDPGNVAGLRIPYELQLIRFDAESHKVKETVKRLDDMIKDFDPPTRMLQEILFTKAAIMYDVDRKYSREVFVQARDVDAHSLLGEKIDRLLDSAFAE